MRPGIPYSYQ